MPRPAILISGHWFAHTDVHGVIAAKVVRVGGWPTDFSVAALLAMPRRGTRHPLIPSSGWTGEKSQPTLRSLSTLGTMRARACYFTKNGERWKVMIGVRL